jgi:protocatechuate 3,4-dioxygenase beta subunit
MKTVATIMAVSLLSLVALAQRPPGAGGRPVDAQPAISPAEACMVEGRVVKMGTGEPLRKARVTLTREGQSLGGGRGERPQPVTVLTNAEGKFAFKDVAPGRYRLSVARNGFVRQEYGQPRPGRPGSALTLAPGQKASDLLFQLLPAGVITGRIYDQDGDPMPGVQVSVLRQRYVRGQRQWTPAESGQTNDLGEYRIAGLAPGRVYLSATAPTSMMMIAAGGNPISPVSESQPLGAETYAPTFYPGTNDVAQARPIEVAAGEEVRGIDLTLTPVRAVSVRGRVNNPFASTGRFTASITLTPRGFAGRVAIPRVAVAGEESEGAFEVRGVPPGSYLLTAMGNDMGRMFAAREFVEVGSADVDGLQLTMSPAVEITGHVKLEGAPDFRFSRLSVSLVPRDESTSGGGGATVSASGMFTIRNVFPDAFRVAVNGTPEDAYVKSVKLGAAEVTDEGLQLARAPNAQLEILLSPNGASVTGMVRDAQQLPAAGATVVLVPEISKRRNTTLYRSTTTDQLGQFILRGIPPGSYKLFAFAEIDTGAWLDAEFLAPFEQKGEAIKLEESARLTADLKLVPANP